MKHRAPRKKPPPVETGLPPVSVPAILFLVTLPFVVGPTGLEKFRVPKDVYTSLAVVLLGIFTLLRNPVRPRLEVRTWEFLLGVGVVYVGLHVLISVRPEISYSAFQGGVYLVALLLILIPLATPRFQQKAWLAVGVALGLNGFFSMLQYFGAFPLMVRAGGAELGGRLIPAGLIGDANSGGFLFGLVCFPLLHGLVKEVRPGRRALYGLLLALNATGLLFTVTLTASFALLVCLILWLAFHHWWLHQNGLWNGRRLMVLWVVGMLVVVGAIAAASQTAYGGRVQMVWRMVERGQWEFATAGRHSANLLTWKMIQDRPLLGSGLGTFGSNFFEYRVGTEYGRSLRMIPQAGAFQQAHNEYLQIWQELGLGGLLLFLGMALTPLIRAALWLRGAARSPDSYWVGMLCLGWVYVLVAALGFFPFQLSVTAVYVVLLLAGLRHLQRGRDEGFAPPDRIRSAGVPGVIVVILIVGGAGYLGYSQIHWWRANQEAGQASTLLERAASGEANPRRTRALALDAAARLERAREWAPGMVQLESLQGSAALLLGRTDEAVERYSRAVYLQPSPEAYTNLAVAWMSRQEFGMARQALEVALRYNPRSLRARRALQHLESILEKPL